MTLFDEITHALVECGMRIDGDNETRHGWFESTNDLDEQRLDISEVMEHRSNTNF